MGENNYRMNGDVTCLVLIDKLKILNIFDILNFIKQNRLSVIPSNAFIEIIGIRTYLS